MNQNFHEKDEIVICFGYGKEKQHHTPKEIYRMYYYEALDMVPKFMLCAESS